MLSHMSFPFPFDMPMIVVMGISLAQISVLSVHDSVSMVLYCKIFSNHSLSSSLSLMALLCSFIIIMLSIFIIMYFLFDLVNSLRSCISLADDRHLYYFQGDSTSSSLVLASLHCFIFSFPVCFLLNLRQSSFCFYFLLSFPVCFLLPLGRSMLPLSIFLLLSSAFCAALSQPSAFMFLFCAASAVVCLFFCFFR